MEPKNTELSNKMIMIMLNLDGRNPCRTTYGRCSQGSHGLVFFNKIEIHISTIR